MVRRETPEKKKKSNCSAEKNRNTQVEQIHPVPRPPSPVLSFFGKRLQRRHLQVILLGVCEIKVKKKEQGNERKQLYLKQ